MSGRNYPRREIQAQLKDLGRYRADVERERDDLVERMTEKGHELDRRLDGIARSAAEWSARAGAAGISESEVVELLGLRSRPTTD